MGAFVLACPRDALRDGNTVPSLLYRKEQILSQEFQQDLLPGHALVSHRQVLTKIVTIT